MREKSSRTHDVFVSYSSKDRTWVDAACAMLERHRIRCWIAPRDITRGDEWGAAIIKGLNGSQIMVLIFSGHANASGQVRREVERAISQGMTVLPVRVEDVLPDGAMEFALGNRHWLDAFTPPVERQMEILARSVKTLLANDAEPVAPIPPVSPPSDVPPTRRPPWVWPSVVVGGLMLGLLAAWLGGVFNIAGPARGHEDSKSATVSVPSQANVAPGSSSNAVESSARSLVGKSPVSAAASREKLPKAAPRPATGADSTVPPKLITNSIAMKLVLIPAGTFRMGSPDREGNTDEHPQHEVRITRPFYLGVTEVTRGQFRLFVDETGDKTDAEKEGKGGGGWNEEARQFEENPRFTRQNPGFEQTDQHPVVNVSWNDAQEFITWLSQKEAKTFRLPTEAEWEYACRAGTKTAYFCGDDAENLAAFGNIADATAKEKYPEWTWSIAARDGYVYTAPVGRFRANPFGLYDLHGNVWEWCQDGYDAGYYKRSPVDDPPGPSDAS